MEGALLAKSARNRSDCLALSAWRAGRIARCGLVWALCAALAGCLETYDLQPGHSDAGRQAVTSPTPTAPPAAGAGLPVLPMRAQFSHHGQARVGDAARLVSVLRLRPDPGTRGLSLPGSASGSDGPQMVRLVFLR